MSNSDYAVAIRREAHEIMDRYRSGEDARVTFAGLMALHAVVLGDTESGLAEEVQGLIEAYQAVEEALRG